MPFKQGFLALVQIHWEKRDCASHGLFALTDLKSVTTESRQKGFVDWQLETDSFASRVASDSLGASAVVLSSVAFALFQSQFTSLLHFSPFSLSFFSFSFSRSFQGQSAGKDVSLKRRRHLETQHSFTLKSIMSLPVGSARGRIFTG